MTKMSKQKLKYLENEKSFCDEKKHFFFIFFARCLDQFKLPGFLNEDNLNELFTRLVELSAKKSTK